MGQAKQRGSREWRLKKAMELKAKKHQERIEIQPNPETPERKRARALLASAHGIIGLTPWTLRR